MRVQNSPDATTLQPLPTDTRGSYQRGLILGCRLTDFGRHTFNAEIGKEGTRYFSRVIHWPGGNASGVTLGPGYDMGLRRAQTVYNDLLKVGVPSYDARILSRGAGLRGDAARIFVERNRDQSPVISAEAERKIFDQITSPFMIKDIQRILAKPDTVKAYGAISWEKLPQAAQELLFDLRYRGDYTPTTRKLLHPALVAGDLQEVSRIMHDHATWKRLGVPEGRIRARMELADRLLEQPTTECEPAR
jgi:hypothetical protein